MSASTIPTDRPESAMATAMFAVTVDLPTPPLPLLMAIMRGCELCSSCAIAVSFARSPEGGAEITRAESGRLVGGQLRRHAGAICRVARHPEMAAVPASAEGRRLPAHGQRRRQPRQRLEEPVALQGPEAVDDVDQVTERILREHRPSVFGQVEAHAATVAFRAAPRDQSPALQRLDDLRSRPPRRRLEAGETRGRAGAAIGPREEPQAGPLRCRQVRAPILTAGDTTEMDEQFADTVRCLVLIDHAQLVSNRKYLGNRWVDLSRPGRPGLTPDRYGWG